MTEEQMQQIIDSHCEKVFLEHRKQFSDLVNSEEMKDISSTQMFGMGASITSTLLCNFIAQFMNPLKDQEKFREMLDHFLTELFTDTRQKMRLYYANVGKNEKIEDEEIVEPEEEKSKIILN